MILLFNVSIEVSRISTHYVYYFIINSVGHGQLYDATVYLSVRSLIRAIALHESSSYLAKTTIQS